VLIKGGAGTITCCSAARSRSAPCASWLPAA